MAKAKPDGLTYGSSGLGGFSHLSGALFASLAEIRIIHVPYKGGNPALNDVIGGQISMLFSTLLQADTQIKAGRLRALAVTTKKRSPAAPDLPTVAESGLPGFDAGTWHAFIGPAGMAPESVALLSREFGRALNLPDVREKIIAMSLEPQSMTPAQLAATVQRDAAKWKRIVAEAGIKLD